MPASITVGIKNVSETLAEAQEYLERGFSGAQNCWAGVMKKLKDCELREYGSTSRQD